VSWTLESLKEHTEENVDRLERRLEQFPQNFATKVELESVRAMVDTIRSDHVQRHEVAEIKTRLNEIDGRRGGIMIAASIIIALFVIAFGLVEKNQLTASDVSGQIAREAPWLSDKPALERSIRVLENQQATQDQKTAALQQLIRTLCRIEKLTPC
jgi:hypothetical protein